MQLKKQLLQWYNNQLQQKNIFLSSHQQLSSGYYFLQVLHNYHPKSVDLSKVYLKPKNEYEILQNYKLLSTCFIKLGWKKFEPQRYSKKKQKDYLSLAQMLKKILSSRNIKQSILHNNLDTTLQQFKNDQDNKINKQDNINLIKNMKIIKLQKYKKLLLNQILNIQLEINKEYQEQDKNNIYYLQKKINQIIDGYHINAD